VLGSKQIPIFELDDIIFKLAGRFRSRAKGQGSADKHDHLGTKLKGGALDGASGARGRGAR